MGKWKQNPFNAVKIGKYTLRFYTMYSGYYGVRAWENGRPIVVSSGNHQYIGTGKSKAAALSSAKKALALFRR